MNTYIFIKTYSIEDHYACEDTSSFCSSKTKEELINFINSSFKEFKKRVLNYVEDQNEYWKTPEIVEFNKRISAKSDEISQKRKTLEKKYSKVPKKDRTPEYNQEIDKLKQEIQILFNEKQSIEDASPKVMFPSLDREFVLGDFSVSFSHSYYEPNFEILTLQEWLEKHKQSKIYF